MNKFALTILVFMSACTDPIIGSWYGVEVCVDNQCVDVPVDTDNDGYEDEITLVVETDLTYEIDVFGSIGTGTIEIEGDGMYEMQTTSSKLDCQIKNAQLEVTGDSADGVVEFTFEKQ